MKEYDVIIIGASISGCAAAMLYGQCGLKVALVERKPNIGSHYKVMCTHTIQASALPIIQKLGVLSLLKDHGGILTHHQIWSKYGWIKRDLTEKNKYENYGLNITRKLLDRVLLEETLKYPTINYFSNSDVNELLTKNDIVCGIKFFNKTDKVEVKLIAKLIVGADGAHSKVAKFSQVGATINPNNRFGYFAYFKHPTFRSMKDSKIWYFEPDIAYAFPNENDLMLLGYIAEKSQAKQFQKNLNKKFIKIFSKFPDSNLHKDIKKVSPFYATGNMKNIFRHEPPIGLVLIGDAALTLDPVAGVGIGYAFQSADLLVEFTRESLIEKKNYHEAAKDYYHHYSSIMRDTYNIISNDSLANPFEKTATFILSNAPDNPFMANLFLDFCARKINVSQFFNSLEFFKSEQGKVDIKNKFNKFLYELAGNMQVIS